MSDDAVEMSRSLRAEQAGATGTVEGSTPSGTTNSGGKWLGGFFEYFAAAKNAPPGTWLEVGVDDPTPYLNDVGMLPAEIIKALEQGKA